MNRKVMERAHEIKKEHKENVWSESLKLAWYEAKIEKAACKRWGKGGLRRLYVKSHRKHGVSKHAKIYYDLNDKKWHSGKSWGIGINGQLIAKFLFSN